MKLNDQGFSHVVHKVRKATVGYFVESKNQVNLMEASSQLTTSQPATATTSSNAAASQPAAAATLSPEVIQALTPIVLALLGGLIGCLALIVPAEKATAALGLAGTAIAGAAGLAKNEGSSISKNPSDEKKGSV